MKALIDRHEVTERSFYFLLDWCEKDNWNYIDIKFNKRKLSSLTLLQYIRLWNYATKSETKYFKRNETTSI